MQCVQKLASPFSKVKSLACREFCDLLLSPASKILNYWFEVEHLVPSVLQIDLVKQLCDCFIAIDSLHLIFLCL